MNNNRKKKTQTPGEERLKSFLDMIAPSVIQFYTDHYICGNTFRSVWALREYPTSTDEQAIPDRSHRQRRKKSSAMRQTRTA